MLRKFAAVLLATTLIAGTAFAAQPSGTAGSTPAAPAAAAPATKANGATVKPATTVKPAKMAAHSRKHARKHYARGTYGKVKVSHHVNKKTQRGHAFAHSIKPGKAPKTNKSAA
jgi:hypothetical protein